MPILPNKANVAGNNETMDDRSPIPAGDYIAHIVKSEMKQTKAKTGHYLALQFKVLEGDYAGRVLFTNLNLDNPNPMAVEIANKELNSICQAVNLEGVEDSEELHQIPMMVSVKQTEATAQWPAGNEITSYTAADGATAVANPSEGGSPEGAEGGRPWEQGPSAAS